MYARYAIAIALLAGFAGLAAAQVVAPEDRPAASGEEAVATGGKGLPMTEIIAALEAEGYTDFREIEREEGTYEVKARNKEGRFVEVYVLPETGKVVRSEEEGEDD